MRKRRLRSAALDLDRSLRCFVPKPQSLDDHFTVRDAFEHMLVTGSTGSGKTSTVGYHLAKGLLNADKLAPEHRFGMIIFLYKSADTEQWLRWCEEQGRQDDVVVIGSEDRDVFNLLNYYRDKEAISAVDALMNLSGLSLGGQTQTQSEPYWEQANRQRLHRLIVLNQLSGAPLSITTLYRLHSTAPQTPDQLDNTGFQEQSYCWQMLAAAHARCEDGQADEDQFQLVEEYFLREMPYMADRTQSSILSLTSSILEPFVSSPLLKRLFCGGTTLSLDQLLSGKIVLLDLPIQQYEQSGKRAQIMFKYILQKRIESRLLEDLPNPVILWLDEYQHYITPYDFLFLSTARSARAGCVLMTQNISNLYAQIGGNGKVAEERVNSLLSLTNHKLFLAQNSFVTNDFASRTIGMAQQGMVSRNVQEDQLIRSAGVSYQYQYQVMPRAFTMLKRGGEQQNGLVEAYLTATGKIFANGKNHIKVGFPQPWLR